MLFFIIIRVLFLIWPIMTYRGLWEVLLRPYLGSLTCRSWARTPDVGVSWRITSLPLWTLAQTPPPAGETARSGKGSIPEAISPLGAPFSLSPPSSSVSTHFQLTKDVYWHCRGHRQSVPLQPPSGQSSRGTAARTSGANSRAAVAALDPYDESSSGGKGTSLTISHCAEILEDARLGDSMSINGTTAT